MILSKGLFHYGLTLLYLPPCFMEAEKTFRTNNGTCIILPDKIILTKDGETSDFSNAVEQETKLAPLIIYSIIALAFFGFALKGFLENDIYVALLFAVLGAYSLFRYILKFNKSNSRVIERDNIVEVEFRRVYTSFSHAYFIIHYKNQDGLIKQRHIQLPGTLITGKEEIENAYLIMESEFLNLKISS